MGKKASMTIILFLSILINIIANDGDDLDSLLFNTVLSISRGDERCIIKDRIENLLKSGANPNILRSSENYTWIPGYFGGIGFTLYYFGNISPLMIARPIEITNLLINYGAEINFQDSYGRTALMVHTFFNGWTDFDEQIVSLLLEKGADVNICDNLGQTALYYAIYQQSPEMVRLLIDNGASVNIMDQNGLTPLQIASYRSRNPNEWEKEIISILEKAGAVKMENEVDSIKKIKDPWFGYDELLYLGYGDR
jgi:hypothetical protein